MKKITLIFVLIVAIHTVEKIHEFSLRYDGSGALFAQDRMGKLDGTIYLANDQTVAMNAVIIKYLTDNIGRIASVGGKTTYLVPVAKEFKKRIRTRLVDGYMVQYAYVGTVNPAVSLQKPKTKYIEFDFKTKKIKAVSKNDEIGRASCRERVSSSV
jgi:hypothetical protein